MVTLLTAYVGIVDPFWVACPGGDDCARGPHIGTGLSANPRRCSNDAPTGAVPWRLPTVGFCGSMYIGVAVGPCSSSSLVGGHWNDPPTTFIVFCKICYTIIMCPQGTVHVTYFGGSTIHE